MSFRPSRDRSRSRRAPIRVEALEPRFLLSGLDGAVDEDSVIGRYRRAAILQQGGDPSEVSWSAAAEDAKATTDLFPAAEEFHLFRGILAEGQGLAVETVEGTNLPSEPLDIFEVAIGPKTVALQIDVSWEPSKDGTPGMFVVRDEAGRDLLLLKLDSPSNSLTLFILGFEEAPTSCLYLGIGGDWDAKSGDPATLPAPMPEALRYELRVSQEETVPDLFSGSDDTPPLTVLLEDPPGGQGEEPAIPGGEDPTNPGVEPPPPPPPPSDLDYGGGPPANPPGSDNNSGNPPGPTDQPSTGGEPGAAPPTETTPPAVAVRLGGDPIPRASRSEAAWVDLTLIDGDLSGRGGEGPTWVAVLARQASSEEPASASTPTFPDEVLAMLYESGILQALRGAGAGWLDMPIVLPDPANFGPQGTEARDPVGLAGPGIVDPSTIAELPALPEVEPDPGSPFPGPLPSTRMSAVARPDVEATADRTSRRSSILSGLYATAALVLGVFGPDLLPVFHSLTTRPSRERRRDRGPQPTGTE